MREPDPLFVDQIVWRGVNIPRLDRGLTDTRAYFRQVGDGWLKAMVLWDGIWRVRMTLGGKKGGQTIRRASDQESPTLALDKAWNGIRERVSELADLVTEFDAKLVQNKPPPA